MVLYWGGLRRRALAWVVRAGCSFALLWASHAWSALPSRVKAGHPRLLLTAQRVDAVRAVTVPPLFSSFPKDRGRLSLDIVPVFAAAANDLSATPLVDDENEHRNHLFIRHVAEQDNRADGSVGLQVTLQSRAGYLTNASVRLKANQLSSLAVTWDNVARQTTLSVNGAAATVQAWPPWVAWRADGERFMFHGRPGEQIQHVRVDDLALGTVVLERGPIDAKLQDATQQLMRAEGALAAQTRALLTCVNANLPTTCMPPYPDLATHSPTDVEMLARSLAVAYLLSGEPRYLNAARHYAGMLLSIGVLDGQPGVQEYAMRGRVATFSVLYDWLFDPMRATPAYASGFANLAAQMAQRIIDHIVTKQPTGSYELGSSVCGNQAILLSPLNCAQTPVVAWNRLASPWVANTASSYLGGGHARSNAAKMAQALLAIHDERPDTQPLLETIYRHFDQGYNPARAWLSVDGGHHMNYSYGVGYNDPLEAERLWQSALEPLSPTPVMDAPWQYRAWLPFLYALRGDMSLPSTGDADAEPYLPWASSLVLRAAVDGGDGHAQAFYDQVILGITQPGAFDVNSDAPVSYLWDQLFFGASKTAERPWTELPLARLFRNAGFATMRDRWTFEDATLLDFKSTSFLSQNHQHFDQNSFSLFYRSPLLLDSGYYAAYGDTHWGNYAIRTIAHNSLVVFDPAESFFMDHAWASNDGGQWLQPGMQTYPTLAEAQNGANHLIGIDAFAQGNDFSYARGNASRAYASNKLDARSGFIRHLVMLRQPSFWKRPVMVMFDQVKLSAGRESLKPTLLFHTTNEPLAVGSPGRGAGVFDVTFATGARHVFDVVSGAGRVFVETLWPTDALWRKLGGANAAGDFRFVVPTKAPDGSFALVNYLPNAGSLQLSAPDVGAWRIEVAASGSTVNREFVHVMSVADVGDASATTAPAAMRMNASADSAAVLLGQRMAVMIFNGTATSPVFWDVPAGLPIDDFLVLGLQAGAHFDVVVETLANKARRITLQPNTAASLQTSSEGALRSLVH